MSKITKILSYGFFLVLFSVTIGCKSKPDTKEDPKPEKQESVQAGKKSEEQVRAEQLFNDVIKARKEALSVHADTAFPAEFKQADSSLIAAKAAYSNNDLEWSESLESDRYVYEKQPAANTDFALVNEKLQQAILQYKTLTNRVQIAKAKSEIDAHNLSVHDAETYKKAEALLPKIESLYNTDLQKSYDLSVEVLGYYEKVKNAGYAVLVGDAKKKADEARAQCDSIKASISMKKGYEKAFKQYRYAGIAVRNEKFEKAYKGYMKSAGAFNKIYDVVKQKRAAALEAMEKAKERQTASSELAKDADAEAPLPETMEGFSDEPIDPEQLKAANEKTVKEVAPKKEPAQSPAKVQSEESSGTKSEKNDAQATEKGEKE